MGGKKSKPVNREELSPELQEMVDDVFKIFDKDGSKTIDKDEAVKHWSKNFGKISANEFFNTVDYNHDGQIQYDEFVDFWKIVKGSGHSEEEIQEEHVHGFCSKLRISSPITSPIKYDDENWGQKFEEKLTGGVWGLHPPQRIKNGESWIGFDNLPQQYMGKDKR